MKKDIEIPKVKDVAVAIVPVTNELNAVEWKVYVVNFKTSDIESVLVSSQGYGELNNEKVETTLLRHFLDTVPAQSAKQVELIMPDVFGLNNQYWVSFSSGGQMLDKKFIFVPDSIQENNLVMISVLEQKGVIIK
ncbi:MAG: hypothetical protein ACPGED_01605 [Flavobacteriales bacterium]